MGCATRHVIDPERMPVGTFQRMATALEFMQLRDPSDTQTIDDRLAEINYYPIKAARPPLRPSAEGNETRSRILDAAAELFDTFGFDSATVTQIARRAKLAPDTVYAHFASKTRVAVELLLHAAALLGDTAEGDEAQALRAQLVRTANLAATRSSIASVYASVLGTSELVGVDDPLVATMSRRVAAAVGSGALRPDLDEPSFAVHLVGVVVRRVLSHPAEGPEEAADYTWRLLIEGAQPSSVPTST